LTKKDRITAAHGWLRWRQWPSVHPKVCFLGPIWLHNPNGISVSWAIFAHLTAECHWACPACSFR